MAIVKVQVRNKVEAERERWIEECKAHMYNIKLYDASEYEDCQYLAESLWDNCVFEGVNIYTPEEAVKEELTYWGE
jgi:hypothetical protein